VRPDQRWLDLAGRPANVSCPSTEHDVRGSGAKEYVRAHWDEINALCKLNSIPFNATGEKIRDEGLWCVYEFTWQMDAILFWDRFEGRWLRGTEFHYPERPKDLPTMEPLKNWPKFDPRNVRS
jgi:hypothetical protein